MTLKEFLYSSSSEVHIVEGPDNNYAKILIIPVEGLGEEIDTVSEKLLNRKVFLFDAIDKDRIKVYLELEKSKVEGDNNG